MYNIIDIIINSNSSDLGLAGLAAAYKIFLPKPYQFKPVKYDQ
jgi:hypothetical protein